jgi:Mn-containing catalase
VRETIDFLLNREEAHNALFREALNRVSDTGSNKQFGVTEDSKLYFDLSTPGRYFDNPSPTKPRFENPRSTENYTTKV